MSQFLWIRNLGADSMGPLPQVSPKTALNFLAGAIDLSRLNWGEINFQAPSCGCWQDLICLGLFEGHGTLMAVVWKKPFSPCHTSPFMG